MPETLDELGPVDWLVVEFPGPDFGKGQIAPFLEDLVKRDLIRVLDMVFLRKTDDGTLENQPCHSCIDRAASTGPHRQGR